MPTSLLLLLCVVIWGWTFVASKICLNYLNPYQLVGLRFAIGLPLLFAILRLKRIPIVFSKREYRPLAAGAAIIAVHFIIQVVALQYTTATNTGWLIAVTPLALTVLSFVFLKEHIAARQIIGILVGSLGVLLLISRGQWNTFGWMKSIGDWLILVSAHTWALYTIVTRDLSRSRNPLTVTLIVFTPLMLLCFVYGIGFGNMHAILSLPPKPIVALAFLGVLGTLTQWFWQIGVARIGAARAGIFLYIEPVATTVLAVPLLHESVGPLTIFGGLLVLGGVWWSQRN
jgi:drug/metabolite transporter (DMT)-like permease